MIHQAVEVAAHGHPAGWPFRPPTPGRFDRSTHSMLACSGELRLAFAVLEDALSCLQGKPDPCKIPPRLFRWEVEHWVESRDRSFLFSFDNVCSMLGLDPDRVRRQVRDGRASRAS